MPRAKAAYQIAIDSGHAEYAPRAAVNLGVLRGEQGDVPGAKAAYQAAIDSGHAEHAPRAALGLGQLLAERGDRAGAKAAYQAAIDSGHPAYAPYADFLLGEQCTDEDLNARRLHREHAAASGHVDLLVSLAELYAVEGDLSSAKRLLNQASSAGCDNADNYLALLEGHGSGLVSPSTITAISAAADAGDTDSMNFLGWQARSQGSREEARSWWARSAAHGDVVAALLDRSGGPERLELRPHSPRLEAELLQPFGLLLIYNKQIHQVTIYAIITPSPPAPQPPSPPAPRHPGSYHRHQ